MKEKIIKEKFDAVLTKFGNFFKNKYGNGKDVNLIWYELDESNPKNYKIHFYIEIRIGTNTGDFTIACAYLCLDEKFTHLLMLSDKSEEAFKVSIESLDDQLKKSLRNNIDAMNRIYFIEFESDERTTNQG